VFNNKKTQTDKVQADDIIIKLLADARKKVKKQASYPTGTQG
jgi:hypothetical protein